MTSTLLVYPPFCTPASPPYSITNIYSFLKNNLPKEHKILAVDLNILFHKKKFSKFQKFFQTFNEEFDPETYSKTAKEYKKESETVYAENNRKVLANKNPLYFSQLLQAIVSEKPDIAAFSIVYSSQVFYACALIKELKKRGIRTVIGGPAVNSKISSIADKTLANELELLEYITQKKADHDQLNFKTIPDFSIYGLDEYFTPQPVIPIRTTSTCYYKKCTFCTHYGSMPYFEFPLENIKSSIEVSTRNIKKKNVFITDDMIHKKRLLELAIILKPLGVSWMCQLKPTKELDYITLRTLREAGLKIIIWGVESASDRVLKLMRKQTNKKDIKKVLEDSSRAGIKNCVYIMFGFPTETKEEALETLEFLKENQDSVDLVSVSIFGLQKGSEICKNPERFGITKIHETGRTLLEPNLSYDVSSGMTHEQAKYIRKSYSETIEKLNKFPKNMNFFREHLMCLV